VYLTFFLGQNDTIKTKIDRERFTIFNFFDRITSRSKKMNKPKAKFLYGEHEIKNNQITIINSSRNADPHLHYFVEIVYFYKGTGTHIINNKKFKIKSGDLFIITPFTQHSYTTEKNDNNPIEVYNICFYANFLSPNLVPEKFIDNIHEELFNRPLKLGAKKTKYIKISEDINRPFLSTFKKIESELSKEKDGYLICVKSLLTYLIVNIFRHNNSNNDNNDKIPLKTQQQLELAIDYLRTHPTENVSLNEFAKKFSFSVSYLNRLLKKHTGFTFNQLQQQERIKKATELLNKTDLSIDEICGRVGYSDIKFFYSIFSKHIGVPPAKYRSYTRKEQTEKQP